MEKFRYSLGVSPYNKDFAKGHEELAEYDRPLKVSFFDGKRTASTRAELEEMFLAHGGTEMWVRINMRRKTGSDATEAEKRHYMENCVGDLELAAKYKVPINPELLCVADYMDFSKQDAPDFAEYPEAAPSRPWQECSLDEMCEALEKYGELMAREILSHGCKVNVWDIGNETNYGFAGLNVGLENAVSPKLGHTKVESLYIKPNMGANWLAENVWRYNAKQFAAVARGVRKADPGALFSVHLSTVVGGSKFCVKYFDTLRENGFVPDQAGISFYPSTPGIGNDRMKLFKEIVSGIYKECGLPVFVAEYAYPSEKMSPTAEFSSWSHGAKGYPLGEGSQARFLKDMIDWGRENGLAGIRPFAPDFLEDWEPMGLFRKVPGKNEATAKEALFVME